MYQRIEKGKKIVVRELLTIEEVPWGNYWRDITANREVTSISYYRRAKGEKRKIGRKSINGEFLIIDEVT
jgi:hypothetical protein